MDLLIIKGGFFNIESLPKVTKNTNDPGSFKLDWSWLTQANIDSYCSNTDELLKLIDVPSDVLLCRDVKCTKHVHISSLNKFYNVIINCITTASKPLYQFSKCKGSQRPGWNEHVADLHGVVRDTFLMWKDQGKPRQGPIFELKKRTQAMFKYALRFIKQNENSMRKDSLARTLSNHSANDFWKEVKLNNSKTPLPTGIDGVEGAEKIVQVWKNHYHDLFNCVRSNLSHLKYDITLVTDMIVSADEIRKSISKLDSNKAWGEEKISAEHLMHASERILHLMAMCITGFLVHGFLPDNLISVILIPVIKEKTGKINSKANYRPIALASIISKLFENILLYKLEDYVVQKPGATHISA